MPGREKPPLDAASSTWWLDGPMVDVARDGYYLVAPAGIPNYGDELIAATWLRYLAAAAPQVPVVVDCLGPQRAQQRLGREHPRVRFHNLLWDLCIRNWSADPSSTVDAVATAVRDAGAGIGTSFEALRQARVIHLLGGGFINAVWPPFAGLLAGITTAAAASGGRAAMSGQGLWPAPDGRQGLIRSLVREFAEVDLRDAASAALVDAGPGVLSCDDVFLDPGPWLFNRGSDAPDVMVCLQSLLSETGPQELVQFAVRTVAAWGADRVGLLECAPDQDQDVLAAARRALPEARCYRMAEVLEHGLPVRPGQTWLTTRFHPHLVAAAGGCPGVALTVKPGYYGTKHQSLCDIGSGWPVQTCLEVPARPEMGGYHPEALRRLRAAKQAVAERIYQPALARPGYGGPYLAASPAQVQQI